MTTIKNLLEAGVHFGHQTRFWNPKMAPYIFGVHDKIHIINLEKTLPLLQEAMNFIGDIAAKKGKILFVGTKFSARDAIKEIAEKCEMPYVNYRWLGGTLTNYKTIRHSVKHLKNLDIQFEKNAFGNLNKKEILNLTRKKDKLERTLGGIKYMNGLPDALFIVDVHGEKIAVQEARKMQIPIIGVIDTNSDPDGIDYPIPGNDDAFRAIKLYLDCAVESILHGKTTGFVASEGNVEDFVEVKNTVELDELLEDAVEETFDNEITETSVDIDENI